MAVTFQSVTTGGEATAPTANVSVNPPSGLTTDDLWLVLMSYDSDNRGTVAATGFTNISNFNQQAAGGAFHSHAALWKKAGASETAVTFTLTATGGIYSGKYISIRISGQHLTTPIDAFALTTPGTGGGSTIDAPDVTVASNGSLAILFAAIDTVAAQPAVGGVPSGTTNLSAGNATPSNPGGRAAYEARNAGAYAPGNWTYASSDDGRCAITVVIAPAAGGSTPPPMRLLTLLGVGL